MRMDQAIVAALLATKRLSRPTQERVDLWLREVLARTGPVVWRGFAEIIYVAASDNEYGWCLDPSPFLRMERSAAWPRPRTDDEFALLVGHPLASEIDLPTDLELDAPEFVLDAISRS